MIVVGVIFGMYSPIRLPYREFVMLLTRLESTPESELLEFSDTQNTVICSVLKFNYSRYVLVCR